MAGIDEYHHLRVIGTMSQSVRNEPSRPFRPTDLDIKPIALERVGQHEKIQNDENEELARQYVEWAVTVATLITENLLSHPFVVLRRQCQVQPHSNRRHILPVTLVPVIVRLHQRQGVTTLWKGLGSCLLVRGVALAVEDSLSKFTPWPKELSDVKSCKSYGQHILLKCVSLAIITPFYSASLVETVQSDIASEKPGLFDVFKEGLCRMISWGSPARGRMLPVWVLVGPTIVHGIVKYVISKSVARAAEWTIHAQNRAEQYRRGALNRNEPSEENIQQVKATASFIGVVTAEVLCFPLETILHRLHLQGTRTIVDNLDCGSQVVPILTGYEGALDCYSETISQEGTSGLFKGFGALILQFTVHWAVIRVTRAVVAKCAVLFQSQSKRPPPSTSSTINASVTPSQQKATTPVGNFSNFREGEALLPPYHNDSSQQKAATPEEIYARILEGEDLSSPYLRTSTPVYNDWYNEAAG